MRKTIFLILFNLIYVLSFSAIDTKTDSLIESLENKSPETQYKTYNTIASSLIYSDIENAVSYANN